MLVGPALAQPVRLDTLTVNAPEAPPLAISHIAADDLIAPDHRSLAQWLNLSPGVFALNNDNAAQGVRVSIRGFGAQAAFGVRGIRVSLDGVPLTLPDGQSDLDLLDLKLIDRMSVVRGPSSSLFGNASGGVVALNSRPIVAGEARLQAESRGDGGRSARAEYSTAIGSTALRASLAQSHFDGPRDHSHVDARWSHLNGHYAGADSQFSFGVSDLQVDALDPGALNASGMRSDREAARAANVEFNAGETIRQQRLHARWDKTLDNSWHIDSVTYLGQRDFANRLPFSNGGQSTFERSFAGLGLTLSVPHQAVFDRPQRFSVGIDSQWQADDRQRYDNNPGGQRGDLTLEQRERAQVLGLFLRNSLAISQRWEISTGVRQDWLTLRTSDRFLSDGNDSGERQLNDLSGDLNLRHKNAAHTTYLRLSTAYQTPTISELANPAGGGFNPDLNSSRSHGLELGWLGQTASLSYELVTFLIGSDDELQSFELEDQPGRSFYRNGGRSQRYGADLGLQWSVNDWQANLAYSLLIAEYADGELDGKRLPGLPRQTLNLSGAYHWTQQLTLALHLIARDALYADDLNTVNVAGHLRANLTAAWTLLRSARQQLRLEMAIDNVLDTEYADNIRINAFGGRAFEPASGRLARASLSWHF